MPLTNHSWLAKTKENKRIGIKIIPIEDFSFKIELVNPIEEKQGKVFTQRNGKAICIRCTNSIDYETLAKDISESKDRELIAVVVQDIKGKAYELATMEDKQDYEDSKNYLMQLWNFYQEQGLIPNEEIKASHQNTLWHYNIIKWNQFFGERQLLVMLTLLKNIKEICKEIPNKEDSKMIATYLAFCLCKHIDRNSIGVGWDPTTEVISHALAFRRPTMIYTHAEINPFEKVSGSLFGMLKNITDAITFASLSKHSCIVRLGSVLHLPTEVENNFDLIITDPPYADDVQYGELSEFFYVWLYRALKDFYPELPLNVPLAEDICVSKGRFGNLRLAKDFYEKAMKESFKKINKSLKDDGLLVLFFAHSSTEAWNLLLEVLRESKFRVVSSYAVRTESILSVLAIGKTSFMSSIIVACRKILEDNTSYFEDLLPVIEDKVKNLLANLTLEHLLELPMTDLLIMTYGKVLEETTQHTVLKSYRADFKPEFENLIKYARDFILKEIVTKLTGRSPNILGSDTSFYIVTKVFYKGILDSNEGLKVAWAYQLNLEDLESRQIAKKEAGITKLMFFDEISFDKKPDEIDRNNLHQQLLYLEGIASREGVFGVKRIVSQSNNFRIQDLKQIINLLIKSYRMRLNKKEILTGKEDKELKILEGLADTLGSSTPTSTNTLEEFMG